jgi:hypothetical protein
MLIRTYGAKTPFRARTRRRDNNIKMNLKELARDFTLKLSNKLP